MNNRSQLQKEILKFLESEDEKIMLITGTHQYEKHMEVLRTINKNVQDGVKVLFRINGKDNIGSIFENKIKSPKLNTRIKLSKLNLYIDTINSRTWQCGKYNISIIYPIDSVCRMKEKQREEIINNLLRNTVNKLFIVSWTDNFDYSWLEEFGIDRKAVFDAEEEDSAYHNRVLDMINGIR
ncbi:TPA: hypothetical protein ACKONR_000646 [Clostridioides difficile]|uniref:hypothetical protein n=1 Tax=Clostridioides difficile TaxID=1496 RepID=UPI0008265877|nr:hypothetical protein [Clostridioides difficile]AXU29690.1 hypothetical protein CDIF102859_04062 [Clostridioides difficile]AXU33478.1 hypothetical protein CDIF102860_04077 [Clostridioides difficile]AXU37264.1 hypothetical protein CDIF102978_04077 [Clostridioides difficile]MBY1133352.1 hypothetical protein [Clostridioides difficile]MBY1884963.1 hypothetical protein [Clostridioides difficile]